MAVQLLLLYLEVYSCDIMLIEIYKVWGSIAPVDQFNGQFNRASNPVDLTAMALYLYAFSENTHGS